LSPCRWRSDLGRAFDRSCPAVHVFVAIGLSTIFLAMLLGGPDVPTADFAQLRFHFDLDKVALDLFFAGVAFVLLERVFPNVRPEQPPLREGWRRPSW
jgi:hypothetical protein